jgi:hypothetical protein
MFGASKILESIYVAQQVLQGQVGDGGLGELTAISARWRCGTHGLLGASFLIKLE